MDEIEPQSTRNPTKALGGLSVPTAETTGRTGIGSTGASTGVGGGAGAQGFEVGEGAGSEGETEGGAGAGAGRVDRR